MTVQPTTYSAAVMHAAPHRQRESGLSSCTRRRSRRRPEPHRRSAPSSSGCVRAREAQARRSRPRPAQRLREFAVSFSSPHLFYPEWRDLRKGGVIENGKWRMNVEIWYFPLCGLSVHMVYKDAQCAPFVGGMRWVSPFSIWHTRKIKRREHNALSLDTAKGFSLPA